VGLSRVVETDKPLARKYRVVAYSRRYHLPNPLPNSEKDASTERQVNDLAEIIKALKLRAAAGMTPSTGRPQKVPSKS